MLVLAGRVKPVGSTVLTTATEFLQDKIHLDFGATYAAEKLLEQGIKISKESIRPKTKKIGQIKLGLHKPKLRKALRGHQSCERCPRFGELIQIDGSPHPWFEKCGESCCLLVFY